MRADERRRDTTTREEPLILGSVDGWSGGGSWSGSVSVVCREAITPCRCLLTSSSETKRGECMFYNTTYASTHKCIISHTKQPTHVFPPFSRSAPHLVPTERDRVANDIATETGATLIHPSNDPNVISGQGTQILEFFEQVPAREAGGGCPVDALIIPLGGGGMLSGICAAAKGMYPDLRIFAAEPAAADDAYRSKEAGELLGHLDGKTPTTVADGLRTTLGCNTWPFVRDMVRACVCV